MILPAVNLHVLGGFHIFFPWISHISPTVSHDFSHISLTVSHKTSVLGWDFCCDHQEQLRCTAIGSTWRWLCTHQAVELELIYISKEYYQRKLGSNTSELRTNRILRLEMMKGGMSSNNIYQKNKKLCSWPWWRVVDHITIHNVTIHSKRIRSYAVDLDEGW